MAKVIDTFEVRAEIKSPVDKFYSFFKYDMDKLITIFPECLTGAQVLEGEEGKVGCLKHWNFKIGGVPLSVKVKTEAVDDEGKIITLALEGDLTHLYKTFSATVTVTDGLAKWSFAYEKLIPRAPTPELFGSIVITVSTLVDDYLLIDNKTIRFF